MRVKRQSVAPRIAAAHSAPREGAGSSNLFVLLYVSSYYYVCVHIPAAAAAQSATRAGASK